jgi:hypothetical protein
MSKCYVLFALALIFNVLMGVGYVLASSNLYDYLEAEMNELGYTEQGLYVIPHILINGFQVEISHTYYENGQVVNLGPLPTVVPNYPYLLFWVSMIGNLVFVALALVLHKSKSSEAS